MSSRLHALVGQGLGYHDDPGRPPVPVPPRGAWGSHGLRPLGATRGSRLAWGRASRNGRPRRTPPARGPRRGALRLPAPSSRQERCGPGGSLRRLHVAPPRHDTPSAVGRGRGARHPRGPRDTTTPALAPPTARGRPDLTAARPRAHQAPRLCPHVSRCWGRPRAQGAGGTSRRWCMPRGYHACACRQSVPEGFSSCTCGAQR